MTRSADTVDIRNALCAYALRSLNPARAAAPLLFALIFSASWMTRDYEIFSLVPGWMFQAAPWLALLCYLIASARTLLAPLLVLVLGTAAAAMGMLDAYGVVLACVIGGALSWMIFNDE